MTIPNWRRTLKKVQAMDRREFGDRCRQEFAKRSDALLSRFHYDFTHNALVHDSTRTGSFYIALAQIDPLLELLRKRNPRQVERIISRAERILDHRFDLLGFEDLHYGQPIDWHLDIVHGKRAPALPFHQVNYLDFATVGDSKITWELNRHQHLVTLAKAYRLTGDLRYGREIRAQWRDWHAANPYPIGINWASSLEVGFRSLSWMWVYYLLAGTEALGSDFRQEWLNAQALNGRHLERYLSTYFSPNTHLLGEGVALFFLGTLCPELSGAPRWKARGWQIVLEEARRQVNPDGLHFEQSTYYHVYALDLFLHTVVLASANAQPIPKELEQVLEKMLNALFLLGAAGPPPRFGDDDGGRVFDPARNRSEYLLDPLVVGAILFNRGDFKQLVPDLTEEAIWLLGAGGIEQWDRLEAKAPASRSTAFEQSGVYVMTTMSGEWVIDGGPSAPQSRGHDHADALSVCLQSGARALLIDPGTCEYVGSERNRFRGTAMHNTLRVDHEDQAEPDGPFSWKQHFHARSEAWVSGQSFDLFVGSHDGYARLSSPVVHRRWVLALRSGIFLVRDIAEGAGEHRLDISWHLAPDLHAESEHVFRSRSAPLGLAIVPMLDHGWEEETRQAVWSPAYGQQSPAPLVNFGARVKLPAEFVTLLVPLREASSTPGRFTRLQHPNATALVQAYKYATAEGEYSFFFGRAEQPWQSGPVSSDAEFVCLSSRPGGIEPDVVFCHGSYVDISGTELIRTKRRVIRCESLAGPPRCTFCSDPDALTAGAAEGLPPSDGVKSVQ